MLSVQFKIDGVGVGPDYDFNAVQIIRRLRKNGWPVNKPITYMDIIAYGGQGVLAVGENYKQQTAEENGAIIAQEFMANPVGAQERAQALIDRLNSMDALEPDPAVVVVEETPPVVSEEVPPPVVEG